MELEKKSKIYLSDNISMIPSEQEKNYPNYNKYAINIILIISIIIFVFFLFLFMKSNVIIKHNKLSNKISLSLKSEKYEIDSTYERISPYDEKYIYIPIIATNDFHGRFFPEKYEIYNSGSKIEYTYGGLEYIAKYINTLRNEFGENRVLYFDSGDNYFQCNETILFTGNNIFEFLNTIGLNGTAIGNHEFLYKRKFIEDKIKRAKFPYLVNNIKDNTNNNTKNVLGNNQENSHLYEIKLNNNDIIKIGVIGITMQIGKDKRFYNVGNRQTWDNISFESYYYNLEQESNKLKEKGANCIILLSHVGLECHNINETSKINMYTKNIKQSECQHDGNSLLYNFIKGLKPGIIDAIIGGDTHNNVHHWIDNIPIMISKGKTKYTNIMYLPFKKVNNEYKLINDDIKIEGPLPSCAKIFNDTKNCEKRENNDSNIKLINYYWHGEKMGKDKKTKPLFDKYYDLYKKSEEKKLCKITGLPEKIKIDLSGDSLLGNLMLDVIKNITRTDISIVNFWMFQNYLSPGYLSLLDFIKLMPHENHICTTEIKGKDIKQMIKAVQKGQRGFQPTSGLKQFVKVNNITKEKEIIDIKLYNKENEVVEIEDEKIYTLSSNNFVLSEYCENEFAEKDSLDIIKALKKEGKIKCSKVNTYIEIMYYFKSKGIIDVNNIVDMTKKRIVFVN